MKASHDQLQKMRLEIFLWGVLGVVRDMMRVDPCGLEQKTMEENLAVIVSSPLL
jgi:hypothetical protein